MSRYSLSCHSLAEAWEPTGKGYSMESNLTQLNAVARAHAILFAYYPHDSGGLRGVVGRGVNIETCIAPATRSIMQWFEISSVSTLFTSDNLNSLKIILCIASICKKEVRVTLTHLSYSWRVLQLHQIPSHCLFDSSSSDSSDCSST